MNSDMSATRQSSQTSWRRLAMMGALSGALVGVGACERLLEVELPDAVTEDTFDDPGTASLQVNSVMASVECAYSTFAQWAAGFEDNYQRYSGNGGDYTQYVDTPGGGECDEDAYSDEWIDPMLLARGQGYDAYQRISAWTVEQVPDRTQLLAQTALYNAVTLDVFGEHFCEFAIDGSPLLTPEATLNIAEAWVDSAFVHINAGGDFAIEKEQGMVASSAATMAYGLRARIRWAKGDLAGAAEDALQVPDGFYAFVLREEGEDRRNMISVMQGGGAGTQAAGFLQGPVKLKAPTDVYGVSTLGSKPNGDPWPNPVPFTGYLDLAIDPGTGRAVDADGYPITTENTPGAVDDERVPHVMGNTAGGPDNIIQKYDDPADDIPLVSWVEMRLIRAEADPANAVAHVNAVRNGEVYIGGTLQSIALPEVTYNPTGDELEDMIIEERRRGLWLEGRFWSNKILHPDKLWFPRAVGEWVNPIANLALNGGVRLLMPEDEYQINENFSLADRGTGCAPEQAPVYN